MTIWIISYLYNDVMIQSQFFFKCRSLRGEWGSSFVVSSIVCKCPFSCWHQTFCIQSSPNCCGGLCASFLICNLKLGAEWRKKKNKKKLPWVRSQAVLCKSGDIKDREQYLYLHFSLVRGYVLSYCPAISYLRLHTDSHVVDQWSISSHFWNQWGILFRNLYYSDY